MAAQPESEFCYFCKKRVYIMERMCAENVFFHRGCLKCDFCECGLRVNNYACDRLAGGEGKSEGEGSVSPDRGSTTTHMIVSLGERVSLKREGSVSPERGSTTTRVIVSLGERVNLRGRGQ